MTEWFTSTNYVISLNKICTMCMLCFEMKTSEVHVIDA